MSKIKLPPKIYRYKARVAIYMADGHIPPAILKVVLHFARLIEAASTGQDWLPNDLLDALYKAAQVSAKRTERSFKGEHRAQAVRLLWKSGLIEKGEKCAKWVKQDAHDEAMLEVARRLMAEDKARWKAAAKAKAKVGAKESLGDEAVA